MGLSIVTSQAFTSKAFAPPPHPTPPQRTSSKGLLKGFFCMPPLSFWPLKIFFSLKWRLVSFLTFKTQQAGECVPEPITEDGSIHFCKDTATMVRLAILFGHFQLVFSDLSHLQIQRQFVCLCFVVFNWSYKSNTNNEELMFILFPILIDQSLQSEWAFKFHRVLWQNNARVPTNAVALWSSFWKCEFRLIQIDSDWFRFNNLNIQVFSQSMIWLKFCHFIVYEFK